MTFLGFGYGGGGEGPKGTQGYVPKPWSRPTKLKSAKTMIILDREPNPEPNKNAAQGLKIDNLTQTVFYFQFFPLHIRTRPGCQSPGPHSYEELRP